MRGTLHESFARDSAVAAGSERGFALVFALVFGLIAVWPMLRGGVPRGWAAALAAAFLLAGLLTPTLLAPLNRAWFRFGMALGRIANPVIMAVIFYFTVVPTGLVMQLLRKDLLRLRFDPSGDSYWIHRDPPGPTPDTLDRQF